MDFELTSEQKDIQKAAAEFAEGEFDKELALEYDQNHTFPTEIYKKACNLGFVGIHYPEELGGQGYGILENALVVEAFCRQDSTIGTCLGWADFGGDLILKYGTEEQKRKYLPPITKGEAFPSFALTEPDHGSDILTMTTTAVKEGDHYIINGDKVFITNGTVSSFIGVLCQTDPEARHRGQSTIIVERGTEGFESRDTGSKMGIRMAITADLTFNNVRVPVENLVGQEGRGFYQALDFLQAGRIECAAQAVGIAQGAFDRALDYAKKREQFGQKIAQLQVIQHKFADMAIKIEAARLLTYQAAWHFDQGNTDAKLISMAKTYAPRVAVEVTDEAIQIFGGYGFIAEYEVERFHRDAKITEIWEGTSEIQKNTIAGAIIGRL